MTARNYRVTECSELEGTCKDHQIQLLSEQPIQWLKLQPWCYKHLVTSNLGYKHCALTKRKFGILCLTARSCCSLQVRRSHHVCSVRGTNVVNRVRKRFAVFTSLPLWTSLAAASGFISAKLYSKEGSPWKRPFTSSASASISSVAGVRRLQSKQFKLPTTSTTQGRAR